MTPAQKRVLNMLHEKGTVARDTSATTGRHTARVLDALFRRNLATVDEDGMWSLTSKGLRKAAGKPVRRSPGSPSNRLRGRNDGVIVTMREQDTGELHTITRPGEPNEALRSVCAVIDGAAGDWRIVTISTPQTIHRDMKSTRLEGDGELARLPEQHMLEQIGRQDLLETRGDVARAARKPAA